MARLGYWNKKPCKYGTLKRPNMHGRVCRKAPRRKRDYSRRRCKYGLLKHPTGHRICKKRPGGGRGGGGGGGSAFLPGNLWNSIFG